LDDYGIKHTEKWEKEKEHFLEYVSEISSFKYLHHFSSYIDELLDKNSTENSVAEAQYSENMTGHEYEHYCARLFEQEGWEANVTQGSGDQGVDIIAKRDGFTLAVQCKKYSQPVGNKAVQEVFSAKQHIGADLAVVITNCDYTKSAKELSNTTGVLLLHHGQINDLPSMIETHKNA